MLLFYQDSDSFRTLKGWKNAQYQEIKKEGDEWTSQAVLWPDEPSRESWRDLQLWGKEMPPENDTGNCSALEVLHGTKRAGVTLQMKYKDYKKVSSFYVSFQLSFCYFIDCLLSGLWFVWNLIRLLRLDGPAKISIHHCGEHVSTTGQH